MNNKIRFLYCLTLSFIGIGQLRAQFLKYSNAFLEIGVGSRALGMGGAQVATVNDATSGYWNPAGLANIKKDPTFSYMHSEYFSGVGKYDYLSAAFPTVNKATIGVSFIRFGVDDIPNTLYLVQPDGSIDYNNITSFSSTDYAVLLSYAKKYKTFHGFECNLGGNAKIIHRSVGTFASATGFGFDAGVQLSKNRVRLGFVLKDFTTTFNAWNFTFTDREKQVLYLTNNDIPVKSTEYTAPHAYIGGAYQLPLPNKISLLAEASAHLTFDGKRNTIVSSRLLSIDPNIGLELNRANSLFVRAGISNFQQALDNGDTSNKRKVWLYQPSVGAGFAFGLPLGKVHIDYTFTNISNQGNPLYTHVFSLRLDLMDQPVQKSKSPTEKKKRRRGSF